MFANREREMVFKIDDRVFDDGVFHVQTFVVAWRRRPFFLSTPRASNSLFFFFFFLHGEIIKAGRIGKMANWIRSPIREGN